MGQKLVLAILVWGCLSCASDDLLSHCPRLPDGPPYTNFSLSGSAYQTKLGYWIDNPTMYYVFEEDLDTRLLRFQANLQKISASLNGELKKEWACGADRIDPTKEFNWSCLAIKIVQPVPSACYYMGSPDVDYDWYPPGYALELMDVPAEDRLCEEKGLTPTLECPCRYRTVLENGQFIVTPPTIYLMHFAMLYTGCYDIWNTPYKEAIYLDMKEREQLPTTLWDREIPAKDSPLAN
jgi:hypothetical protein